MNTDETARMAPIEQALVTRFSKKDLSRWVEEHAIAYKEMLSYYRAALARVEGLLHHTQEELLLQYGSDPIDATHICVKPAEKIVDATLANGLPLTVENMEKHQDDIACMEIVCTFPSELFLVADALLKDTDLVLLEREDNTRQPQSNGYRGLHLLLSVPVTLGGRTRRVKVTVRLRTGVMQLWSDIEQKLSREKDVLVPEQVREELRACAEIGAELDARLEQIRYNIDHRVITK